MELSRRLFLKLGAAGGGAATLAAVSRAVPGGRQALDADTRDLHRDLPEEWIASACGACAVACPLLLRRIGGNVVGVRPLDPKPCARAYVIPHELVHPDRVVEPMRRSGDRLEKAGVEDAVAALAEAMREAGPRCAIVTREDAGLSLAVLRALFAKTGAAFVATQEQPEGEPPLDALAEATGWRDWAYDLANADGVISFGWDWLECSDNPPLAQRAWRRTREQSLPTVFVGPRLGTTAMRSREWVACRPGTEPLVALALGHLLARDKVASPAAAAAFEKFDLAAAERTTGVTRSRLSAIARLFRGHRMLAVTCRGRLEDQRAVLALSGLLGQVGRAGGIVATPRASLPVDVRGGHAEAVPAAIEKGEVDTILLVGVNPVFASPAPARWRSALEKAKRVFCLSTYFDETTRLAHGVLPLAPSAERRDLVVELQGETAGTRAVEQAVASRAIDPAWLAFELARRLAAPLPWKTLDAAAKAIRVERPAPRAFEAPAPAWSPAAVADGEFHLLVDRPAALAHGDGAQHPYLVSTVAPHLRQWWVTWLEINPAAAARLGIRDRDRVLVESATGSIRAFARFFEGVPPDAVCVPWGLGRSAGTFAPKEGGNPAELAAYRADERTGVPYLAGQRVRVRKV